MIQEEIELNAYLEQRGIEVTETDAGIFGVNFMVAKTGTLCLLENEGNGRLSTTAPRLHIAITDRDSLAISLGDGHGLSS